MYSSSPPYRSPRARRSSRPVVYSGHAVRSSWFTHFAVSVFGRAAIAFVRRVAQRRPQPLPPLVRQVLQPEDREEVDTAVQPAYSPRMYASVSATSCRIGIRRLVRAVEGRSARVLDRLAEAAGARWPGARTASSIVAELRAARRACASARRAYAVRSHLPFTAREVKEIAWWPSRPTRCSHGLVPVPTKAVGGAVHESVRKSIRQPHRLCDGTLQRRHRAHRAARRLHRRWRAHGAPLCAADAAGAALPDGPDAATPGAGESPACRGVAQRATLSARRRSRRSPCAT